MSLLPSFNPSVGNPPPPPSTIKPKKPRRKNKLPAILVAAFALIVLSIIIWVLLNSRQREEAQATAQVPFQTASSADEIIAKAPPNPAILPAAVAMRPPQQPVSQTPGQKAGDVDPEMMPLAVEARRAAWQTYYQSLQAKQDHQRQALMVALGDGSAVSAEGARANQEGGRRPQMGGVPGTPDMPGMPQSVDEMAGMGGYGGAHNPGQHRRDFFLEQDGDESDYSKHTVTAPISQYELKAGATTIFGRMVSGLNSDSAGIIRAVVTQHVYDYATGMHILIPQGSTLVGTYDNAVAYGQRRIAVAWTRIIYPRPGAESLRLGRQPGMDAEGYSGFQDQTDNHYGQVFTNAILLSLFSAGVQLSQPQATQGENIGPGQIVASSLGQQFGQLGQEFARRGLDIPPTNIVRNGYEFAVILTKDIAFLRPWQPSTVPGQSKMVLVDDEE